jgi:tetratricopeptide (TPR) repeat protein
LRVVAQASCEAVKQRALAASEMAKELSVSFLLDGNVSFVGDRLKVATELIDGKTGFSKWSDTFDRSMAELSLMQDAIAGAVTRELAVDIEKPEEGASFGATKDSAAFDDYLRGNELYTLATSLEADLDALAHFDRALARDPNFGAACAAKARSLTSLGNTADNIVKAHLYYEGAVDAAQRAIEFGPNSADAYSTLGYVLFQAQLKVAEAREPYEKSYELGLGFAPVVARYALYSAATRNFETAKKAIDRARALDPLNATIHRGVGFVQYAERNYEASIQSVTNALSLNPKLSDSHARIAMANIALGKPAEALAAAKVEKSGMMRLPALAIAARKLGDDIAADAALAELVAGYGDAGLYQQAQILSGWGRADAAMAVLKRAFELGDSGLTYAYIDPALDVLRERPDFKSLLKSLGFI